MQWGGCGLEDWESLEKYDIVKKTWTTSWFNEDWDWILEEIFKMQVPRTYIQQNCWSVELGEHLSIYILKDAQMIFTHSDPENHDLLLEAKDCGNEGFL